MFPILHTLHTSRSSWEYLSWESRLKLTRRRINQFDPSSGTAISSYGEKVAPPRRREWSSSCYICVLIFLIFYMFVVFGVMVFKKTDLQERGPADGLPHAVFPFRALFCLFCASLPSAVCEKRALPFLMRAPQCCANSFA
jgi:hypothetical protein